MEVRLVARLWVVLAGFLPQPSLQQDDVFGNDYLVDELPGQLEKTGFRPKSAREAMKQASRLVQKIQSDESDQSYAVLRGVEGARGLRVQVRDAVAVTTSRYTIRRPRNFRNFRKFQRASSDEVPEVRRRIDDPIPPRPESFNQRPSSGRSGRRPRHMDRDRLRYMRKQQKKTREKRAIEDRTRNKDGDFKLPPMSAEEDAKKKKKKKKKKKSTTEEPTTMKKMQKKSKKFRIYMESDELALGNVKGRASAPKIVENLSKELDRLLKKSADMEEEPTSKPKDIPTKTKFKWIPKNWANPPSWRPPTRGPGRGMFRGRMRAYSEEIVTIGPQIVSEESTEKEESSTSYNGLGKEKLELKPAPEGWPEPTHPADGVYDWHKSQFKRGPIRMRRPAYVTFTSRAGANQKHFSDETAMFRRNDMWQTRPYLRQTLPTLGPMRSTWPTIGIKRVFSLMPQDKDVVHLTTGRPLAPVDWKKGDPAELKEGVRADDSGQVTHQESHHQSYHHGREHAAWQGHSQGVRRGRGSHTQYQGYQHYYANYTNYYSQYYQNYYSQLANKSAAYHHEQAHHVQDKHSASGYYQSHYFYQGKASRQSELKPPAYFLNPDEETTPRTPREGANSFNADGPPPTFEIPYRFPNEYAGKDRDLRIPPPSPPPSYSPHSRIWGANRGRGPGPLRRGYQTRHRRGGGLRPTGFRSIFTAPLQKLPWTTSTPR